MYMTDVCVYDIVHSQILRRVLCGGAGSGGTSEKERLHLTARVAALAGAGLALLLCIGKGGRQRAHRAGTPDDGGSRA